MLAWLRLLGWAFFGGIFFFAMRRPRLLRIGLGFFRRRWPIFTSPFSFGGTTVLVSRAEDVREVLERSNEFLLAPVNRTKILSGDFIIGLDPERRYRAERGTVRDALPLNRLRHIEDIVDRAAAAELRRRDNPFEVVEFAERVTVAIVREFWGLDSAGASSRVVQARDGDGADTMRLWLRKLAIVLGSMHPAPFGIREAGVRCSEEFLSFVRAACEARAPGSPDMIGHILWHSGEDRDVTVRNIAGLVMTGSAVVTKAFAHALDQLLRDRRALAAATRAARRGDRVRVARLLLESLRFNPVFPILPRYCARATTLARGTPRETEIPAGANVIASATGAMFDPEAVEDPERFGYVRRIDLNRNSATPTWDYGSPPAADPAVYLVFGAGEHWCLGDQMALAELGSMGTALLGRGGLRNARLARGLRYDGSAVASLLVRHR